jgi:hypothetical protein
MAVNQIDMHPSASRLGGLAVSRLAWVPRGPAVMSWRARSLGWLLTATILSACGSATTPRLEAPAAAKGSSMSTSLATTGASLGAHATADGKVRVTFVDLDSFDKQVERALASGAEEIEIQLLAGMSPNQISPRLGRWINTVQDNGGEVSVTGGPRTRSFGLLASLGEAIYAAWKDLRLRSLVRGVDAEMALAEDKIQRVTLRRR